MVTHQEVTGSVRRAYSAAAEDPQGEHPFPVGRDFAESLGYPPELLDQLPVAATDAFTGVSNVSVFAAIAPGATVLDLGCGGGLDSMIASRRVGPGGAVMGADFSPAMLRRARCAAVESGAANTTFYQADAAVLPLRDGSVDLALVNGIFNLNPRREYIFQELARVLRPGGTAYVAELILKGQLPGEVKSSEVSWSA